AAFVILPRKDDMVHCIARFTGTSAAIACAAVLSLFLIAVVNADLEWKMRMEKMFQEKFSPELLRTETCSRQSGNIPLGMGDISEPNVSEEWYAANKKTYERARVLGFLVHEIKTGLASGLYPQPVQDFGYGLPECKVVNYWDDN